jgi:uncharacterized protein YbaR (Trm112 family)
MCNCGNNGHVEIEFERKKSTPADQKLMLIKNRWHCPKDRAPLITILEQNLAKYNMAIVCNSCNCEYHLEK